MYRIAFLQTVYRYFLLKAKLIEFWKERPPPVGEGDLGETNVLFWGEQCILTDLSNHHYYYLREHDLWICI